jgi:hypothetical protein
MQRCWLNHFFGCSFEANETGINIAGTVNNNSFFGARINRNTGDGVLVDAGNNQALLFSGCEIEANDGNGIHVSSSVGVLTNLTVDTCYFEANDEYDIHLNKSSIVNSHFRNNFHFMSTDGLGIFYGQAHGDLYIDGYFSSADVNETSPGFKTDSGGTNIIRGPISVSGWNSGANFYSLNAATKLISMDAGLVFADEIAGETVRGTVISPRPTNADKTPGIDIQPTHVSASQTEVRVKTVTKSLAVTHTNGVATNTDFAIIDAEDEGWCSAYIIYTYYTVDGSASVFQYGANWSVGAISTSGTAWDQLYSALLDEHFSSGGANTASAINDSGTLKFRHTIASGGVTNSGIGTMTAILQYATTNG